MPTLEREGQSTGRTVVSGQKWWFAPGTETHEFWPFWVASFSGRPSEGERDHILAFRDQPNCRRMLLSCMSGEMFMRS